MSHDHGPIQEPTGVMGWMLRSAGRVDRVLSSILARYNQLPDAVAVRTLGLILGLPTGIVVGLSRWLEPSPDGFGTHRQLGLAGCTVMTLTGWPCPMCGMTTTFALMADGEIAKAFANQPFGPFLFTGTLLVAVLGILDIVTGYGFIRRAASLLAPFEQKIAIGMMFGLIGGWFWKMAIMHPETFGLVH